MEKDLMGNALNMELLAPAGGYEQLHAAVNFGADAVYLAADRFGMRARAANFPLEQLPEAVSIAHDKDVKVHVAVNVMMMQDAIDELPEFLAAIDASGADALIIGDMGAFALAREHAPNCELHVSTQASVSNSEAAKIWHSLGAKRIVCAREMTLSDIAKMRAEIPDDLEIEAFVHGAQCMAVSGRCLLSSYLTGRSGNQGYCTQPCRWSYTLEEEKRPDVHFPIEEDEQRTYIMNAKDLCMIDHLQELSDAGVDSVKIEGRNKKAFYVANVVNAYRFALDGGDVDAARAELECISHRPYSTGFYFGEPEQALDFDGYEQETIHVADVMSCEESDSQDGMPAYDITVRCRNRFDEGQELEVIEPKALRANNPTDDSVSFKSITANDIRWIELDGNGNQLRISPVDSVSRAMDDYLIRVDKPIAPGSLVRIRSYRRSARSI